jgi:putative modified peptide
MARGSVGQPAGGTSRNQARSQSLQELHMSFSLPEPIALDLLHKLGNDDGFRDRFAIDARAALAELGFAPAADAGISAGIWKCLSVESLASKEAVRASHAALFRQVTAERASAHPISLEVKQASARRVA